MFSVLQKSKRSEAAGTRRTGVLRLHPRTTVDHGNADEMYDKPKAGKPLKAKTSHTLNKVPFIVYGADVEFAEGEFGLANVAATVAKLLDIEPNENWLPALIK